VSRRCNRCRQVGNFPSWGMMIKTGCRVPGSVFDIVFPHRDPRSCFLRPLRAPVHARHVPTKLPQPRRRRLSFGPGHARFPAEGDGVDFGQPAGSAGELDQCRRDQEGLGGAARSQPRRRRHVRLPIASIGDVSASDPQRSLNLRTWNGPCCPKGDLGCVVGAELLTRAGDGARLLTQEIAVRGRQGEEDRDR
jgi:hypothetical protein